MKRRSFLAQTAAATASALSASGIIQSINADDSTWQSWRGPNRDGLIPGANWPQSIDESALKLVWEKSFGDSYSGPVLTADSVFTTETKKGKERVFSLARTTGEIQWQYDWDGSMTVPMFAARNGSWIRSTPTTDGTTLFVGGIRDVLVALDCESGTERWRVDFGAIAGKVPDFGMACSPLVDGEFVYVQAGKGVSKLRISDGSIVWNSLGDSGDIMTSGSFSSPVIQTLNGKRQLIVQTRTKLAGLDLETGVPAWSYEVAAFRGMNILTPTLWDNAIFTSSYGGRSLLLDVPNNDSTKLRWENKLEGYMSSPVIIDHYLYMHLRNKRFVCIDLELGKEMWTTKPFGEYWSMVSNGKSILALDQKGQLRLIANNPNVAGNQIAVRSLKKLTLFDWKG
jgi:outer membrane protein assembly factor BamB